MTFEKWLTKHADVKTFDDTEGWLHDLCVDGLNMGDDILMYMQSAYEAGWNNCRDKWGGMEYEETTRDEN